MQKLQEFPDRKWGSEDVEKKKEIRSHLSWSLKTKGLSSTLPIAGSAPVLPSQSTSSAGCVCC